MPRGEGGPTLTNASAGATLVYSDHRAPSSKNQMVWVNRRGEKVDRIGQPQREFWSLSLSPNGRFLATGGDDGENLDIWVHDAEGTQKTRLTFQPAMDADPIWSPSGNEVAAATRALRPPRNSRKFPITATSFSAVP